MNKIIRYHDPHEIEGKHGSPRGHYFIYRCSQSKKKVIIFMIVYKHKVRREVDRSQNIYSVRKYCTYFVKEIYSSDCSNFPSVIH